MFHVRILLASLIYFSSAQAASNNTNLTVALVRVPPPDWPLPILEYNWGTTKPNLTSSVDAGIRYINEAKDNGANWIVFPELWFPGFPKGSEYNNWTSTHLPAYIENAMVVGGPEWNRLIDAIKGAEIYAGLTIAQKLGDNLFMAQALISPSGDELIFRHKLRPSGVERDIFSDGTIDQLKVITSSYGRVGMLECGEHWYPSMTFAMQAQTENFHLGAFPYMGDVGDDKYLWWEGAQANTGAVGLYSNLAGAYSFVSAIGHSFVVDPLAQVVASISANASFDEFPMLYHSLDTTGFNTSKTYDSDSQVSWGVLQQISDAFPKYIPAVEGSLVPKRNVSIQSLLR
ncbi:aliphatic nitrilase [Macroventuria anomochaeta]|uniref:Aliphatic nitrilase n=1 Tax=Macroventuria anomochaeta TaxID=301207 RepID=A0ACB6RIY3_9PLEO|nr:aliphatic nitrilase [Macroventuria anomochaeta]KAF2621870.1 aliphatic nitrilase [Macroventuria anomochaeta]